MRRKLVIIDDEDDIREILRHALELTRDWQIIEAHNGEAGVELVRAEDPDAVLLDVMMPKMDGRQVFRALKEDPLTSYTPVIFITASIQKADLRDLEALQPKAVLTKPFDPLTIADTLEQILGW